MREDRIVVYLNGSKINEWLEDDPNVDLATGHIGLQTHGSGDDVYFRNIRVRDILEDSVDVPGTVGGNVPATLSLALGAPASFGTFTPGDDRTYEATTTATVTSTAGWSPASSVSPQPAYLANGAFTLSEALGVAFSKSAWAAPVSNDPVTIRFSQHIGRLEPLRTGSYSKTLTFTLSTTNP